MLISVAVLVMVLGRKGVSVSAGVLMTGHDMSCELVWVIQVLCITQILYCMHVRDKNNDDYH